jgi:hypothetical protein
MLSKLAVAARLIPWWIEIELESCCPSYAEASDLNDSHIAAFAARSPRRRKALVNFELAVMRLLLGHLRNYIGLQWSPSQHEVSAADALLKRYEDYLRKDRGPRSRCMSMYRSSVTSFPLKPHKRACPGVVRRVDHLKLHS